ncbi:MAG: hypothetical protein HMLKMBBP_03548 [Planctomycetes bacterium]|nr:hypothetical protein [Planctomycetota bacterium]
MAALAAAPFGGALVRGEAPFFLDLSDHWYPFRLHAWKARQEGELAHWWGNVFCGMPFLAQAEAALSYPLHWVTDLIHPAKTLLPQILLHRFLLGAVMYAALIARGHSRLAASLGGGLLLLSGITTTCFSQMAVLRTLAWLPLLVLASARFRERRLGSGAAWTALAVGLGVVSGYPPFLQRAAVFFPVLLVLDPGMPRTLADWNDRLRTLCAAGAGAALGAGLGAAQLLPTLHATSLSQRQLGLDPDLLQWLRAEPSHLWMMLSPRLATDNGVVKQGFAYLGALPVALGAVAVAARRPGAAAFAAVALLSVVASLGTQTPLGHALDLVPLASSFRNPSQYLVGWVLYVPVLAAMGMDALRGGQAGPRVVFASSASVAGLLVVAALVPTAATGRELVQAGIAFGGLVALACRAAAPASLSAAATVIVAAAALLDAGSLGFGYPTAKGRLRPTADLLRPDAPFAAVAEHHRASGDAWPPRAITSDAVFNWENHGEVADVGNVRGLSALAPLATMDLARILEKGAPFPRVPPKEPLYAYGPTRSLNHRLFPLFGARYAVGWTDAPGAGWTRVADGVWDRGATPQAWVSRVPAIDDSFMPPAERIVDAVPSAIPVNGATMTGSAGGVLVWSQSFDPGWACTVNGTARDVRIANHAFMAVDVPDAAWTAEWRYTAPGWRAGAAISLASLAALIVLAFRSRRMDP